MSSPIVVALALVLGQAQTQPPAQAQPQQQQGPAQQQAPASAAGTQAAASKLTLEEALSAASARNLDLKAADARLRQAQQTIWKAWAGYLPSVTASGNYTRNKEGAEIPAGVFGPDAITIVAKEALSGQVDVSQMLFSPALWFGIKAASDYDDVSKLGYDSFRRDILFGIAQVYYAVASLKRLEEVAQRLLEIQQRQEKDARVRYQAGTIAKVGLLRAEIERARAEQDVVRAHNNYESARISLARLLDRAADFEVVDPPEPSLPADRASLEEGALRDRPDVQAARRNVDLQHANRNSIVGGYLPNVSAFGRYQLANAAGFTGSEFWLVGVAAQWNILDGGRREANLREANARIDEALASSANAEARAREDVKQALLDLESARANAAKAKEQRELAAENSRLIDVSYRAGAATAVEQADAATQLRNAEVGLATEALSAQLAALRVLKVAGAPLK